MSGTPGLDRLHELTERVLAALRLTVDTATAGQGLVLYEEVIIEAGADWELAQLMLMWSSMSSVISAGQPVMMAGHDSDPAADEWMRLGAHLIDAAAEGNRDEQLKVARTIFAQLDDDDIWNLTAQLARGMAGFAEQVGSLTACRQIAEMITKHGPGPGAGKTDNHELLEPAAAAIAAIAAGHPDAAREMIARLYGTHGTAGLGALIAMWLPAAASRLHPTGSPMVLELSADKVPQQILSRDAMSPADNLLIDTLTAIQLPGHEPTGPLLDEIARLPGHQLIDLTWQLASILGNSVTQRQK